LSTERVDGFVVEHGAEGFVARSQALPRLAHELGLSDTLQPQLTLRSYGYRDGALHALAPGEAGAMLGLQVSSDDLGQGIQTFRAGMGALPEALVRALAANVTLRTGEAVVAIERDARALRVTTAHAVYDADAVVVATSARVAATLLTPIAADAAAALSGAPVLDSVTVSLAFDAADVHHPLDATGFVVAPEAQRHGMRACTFTTSKFAHRAPEGRVLLRAFFRPAADDITQLDDAAWAMRARGELQRILGIEAAPLRTWVSRWAAALPVHTPAHRETIATLEAALQGSAIILAGAAFHGAGIDAAARSAERAVEVLAGLAANSADGQPSAFQGQGER